MERTQLRIVAGSLKGRKLTCNVHESMRPTPQRVRESIFSILGNAIPERAFYDVFAGTGIVGLEALSRGATETIFIERDFGLATGIENNLAAFKLTRSGHVLRLDAYRWADRFRAPAEPINVFFSPPFPDLIKKPAEFSELVTKVFDAVADGSVITIQAEDGFVVGSLPPAAWDARKYGRNRLFIAVKGEPVSAGLLSDDDTPGRDEEE